MLVLAERAVRLFSLRIGGVAAASVGGEIATVARRATFGATTRACCSRRATQTLANAPIEITIATTNAPTPAGRYCRGDGLRCPVWTVFAPGPLDESTPDGRRETSRSEVDWRSVPSRRLWSGPGATASPESCQPPRNDAPATRVILFRDPAAQPPSTTLKGGCLSGVSPDLLSAPSSRRLWRADVVPPYGNLKGNVHGRTTI